MKGIRLFLSVLLIPLVFQAAFADDEIDTSRAATRRGTTTTVSSNRQKSDSSTKKSQPTPSRATDTDKHGVVARERSTTNHTSSRTNYNNVVSRTPTEKTPANKNLSARTTSNIQSRANNTNNTKRVTTRSTPQTANKSSARVATNTAKRTISRSATDDNTNATELFKSRNFSACKNVFFGCMDEFCANKDSTLKRCACSARINDFDRTKKNLEQIEDKLLDFSERLLTVNLDKEDALAMNTPTEGELASIEDKTKSTEILNSIAKKTNASFDDDNFNQGLNAISLSLNTDAAFDSVDSMLGASTTAKSGTALYVAALPVCREMAMEVCSESDQKIAEESYQLAITQDCNLVQKSYETQTEQARNKIFESGALLDMSRLDVYQKRNSDDILTCKRKMIEALTSTTVCGANMSKCLDTNGKYINPSTGEAVLTSNLYELTDLIKRPTGNETWRSIPKNEEFVRFLNTKKIYLEPAMEKCQNISDYVWESFMEDALAQIKLAQDSKINELRQSCTTLTTQCLTDAAESIKDFDARAISIFGVKADYTVNQMCADIKNACTALINTKENPTTPETPSDWDTGMTNIATEKTYETIIATCREVGKNCIIQACSAISGNFGLCENIDTSINRKSIINRRSCWDEVRQCVADAGADAINKIMELEERLDEKGDMYQTSGDIYEELYGTTYKRNLNLHDWAKEEKFESITDGQIYRLTEQIWGNCEQAPNTILEDEKSHNKIIVNYDSSNKDNQKNKNETLLSWFARNTKTASALDSCRDTTCKKGYTSYGNQCTPNNMFADSGEYCPNPEDIKDIKITKNNTTETITTCCPENNFIKFSNGGVCCKENRLPSSKNDNYAATSDATKTTTSGTPTHNEFVCGPTTASDATLVFSTRERDYFCVGGTLDYGQDYIRCVDGYFVAVSTNNPNTQTSQGHHYTPTERNYNTEANKNFVNYDENIQNFYYQRNAVTYNNNTPVIDCTKQIIEDTEKDNNSGTTWHDWKAATKKDNTCNYKDLDTTSQPAPNIWNISMPLLGKEIETQ
jgi:hypothetical protein